MRITTLMNTAASILVLIGATAALAAVPQFEIEARYEGFDPSFFKDVQVDPAKKSPEGVLAAPRVTTKAGQTAVIQIGREVVLPITQDGEEPDKVKATTQTTTTDLHGNTFVNGRKTANCGVILEVSPNMKDGQITLSGKSTIRRLLNPGPGQALNAVSFASRETFFNDEIKDGQTVVIHVGESFADKAKITLTIKAIASNDVQSK